MYLSCGLWTNLSLKPETVAETIESDPLCIKEFFQDKSVAYFLFITTFLQTFLYVS